MRKTAVILAASLALVAAGCSTKSSGGGGGTTTPTNTDTRAIGVTPTTIKLGITTLDLAAIRQLIDIDQGDAKTAYTAAINQINASGGINGRKIVPYFAPVNPTQTTFSAAACTKLAQDDKVFAVIGYFRNDDPLCYTKTHDTPIVGASLTPTQQKQSTAPWFNTSLTTANQIPKALAAFKQQGLFNGKKVAVVGMAADATDVNSVALPELKKLGVPVVQTAINDASTNDLPALYQQFGLIIQKLQSAGADVVITVGNASDTWPQALQVLRSKYKPQQLATDYNSVQAYTASSNGSPDYAVLNDLVAAYGGIPDPKTTWNTDTALKNCVAAVTAAHPSEPVGDPVTAKVGAQSTWTSAWNACAQVYLFADIARAAGKTLNNSTFNTGGESLKNLSIPGSGPEKLNFGPTSHDGGEPVTIETWNPATKQFDARIVTTTGQ
jgi:ABC-type branched-subunit amino acid transport system substrate-binding protein